MSHPPSSVAPVSPVPAIGVELPLAVFDDVSWMRVEQMFLQQFCAQRSRVQRQCGGCALLLKALCSATGAHCLVILPLPIEVETPWMHAFEAIRPGRRLTFRRGSSLMVRQVGLSHTMWSGSSIPFPLALVCRTLVPGPKNTFLTVCFRFASWTGQFIVVPRAIWIVFDITVQRLNVMSVHDLVRATPLPRQLHPNSKIVV